MRSHIIAFIGLIVAMVFITCQKELFFDKIPIPAGTWQFTENKLYVGNIDTAFIQPGITRTLNLLGRSTDGRQNFLLRISSTDSIITGTYKASLFQTSFHYSANTKSIYEANNLIGEFIVTITALGNNSITGIFSGTSKDSLASVKPITLGRFTSRIDLSTNTSNPKPASGFLGQLAGICSPVSITGTYREGVELISWDNTVLVQATVVTPGAYTITSDTVNGVSFSASGTFTTTGVKNVTLMGYGTPGTSGANTFTARYGSSTCNFTVSFLQPFPDFGKCHIDTFGDYRKGIALTLADSIHMRAYVTIPAFIGTYTFTTDTVNGVSFTTTNTFTSLGPVTLSLSGTGTPLKTGTYTFTAPLWTEKCTFEITFW